MILSHSNTLTCFIKQGKHRSESTHAVQKNEIKTGGRCRGQDDSAPHIIDIPICSNPFTTLLPADVQSFLFFPLRCFLLNTARCILEHTTFTLLRRTHTFIQISILRPVWPPFILSLAKSPVNSLLAGSGACFVLDFHRLIHLFVFFYGTFQSPSS